MRMVSETTTKEQSVFPYTSLPDLTGKMADKLLAQGARALAHPIRVRILRMLLRKNQCLCGDMVKRLPLAQSTISQHLKVLKEAGLIQGWGVGAASCYCVNRENLKRLKILWTAL